MSLEKMHVIGGRRLVGEIPIAGAKNAALPLLAATILTARPCRLRGIPNLRDVDTMLEILRVLGIRTESSRSEATLAAERLLGNEAPYEFVRKMRASVLLLGPLLARTGSARVALPGGCAIGVRPINLHLEALHALGAEIHLSDGYVEARATRLVGTRHRFPSVTVTGTINVMMAAAKAEGVTRLENCAEEPEVIAVAEALSQMGVPVRGAGGPLVEIEGKNDLGPFDVTVIPDRIEAGTYLVAGALTEGDLFLKGARTSDLSAVTATLREAGAEVTGEPSGIRVRGKRPIRALTVTTEPHPGFPTDMQAQMVTLLSLAKGKSRVVENIFENRFMHVAELARMGARIEIHGNSLTIEGVDALHGAPVMATDLRASASLVLAGLAAEGLTEILRIYHLDRGYERMDAKLAAVGADIRRLPA